MVGYAYPRRAQISLKIKKKKVGSQEPTFLLRLLLKRCAKGSCGKSHQLEALFAERNTQNGDRQGDTKDKVKKHEHKASENQPNEIGKGAFVKVCSHFGAMRPNRQTDHFEISFTKWDADKGAEANETQNEENKSC